MTFRHRKNRRNYHRNREVYRKFWGQTGDWGPPPPQNPDDATGIDAISDDNSGG
ncbi:hypothetical protein TPY_0415 [Sulfobacillus acidophilus TPY]|nr:hypothetical protein TPY_0415 [Sulfobacillus acidophilus TPY]